MGTYLPSWIIDLFDFHDFILSQDTIAVQEDGTPKIFSLYSIQTTMGC